MAYNETYSSDDLGAVTIDGIVGIGVALVSFASLIGLILLWGWLKRNLKR